MVPLPVLLLFLPELKSSLEVSAVVWSLLGGGRNECLKRWCLVDNVEEEGGNRLGEGGNGKGGRIEEEDKKLVEVVVVL